MQHRDAFRPGERDREAVGDEDERGDAGNGGDVPVALGRIDDTRVRERARLLRPVVALDLGSVHLARDHDPLGVEAKRTGEAVAVAPDRGDVVAGEDRDVEAVVGRGAGAAEAGREGGVGTVRKLGGEPAHPGI